MGARWRFVFASFSNARTAIVAWNTQRGLQNKSKSSFNTYQQTGETTVMVEMSQDGTSDEEGFRTFLRENFPGKYEEYQIQVQYRQHE